MSEYNKKLHIRKNGIVTDIKLYTTPGEVGSNYLALRVGGQVVYAKLDSVGAINATNLRVRKDGTVYQVCSQADIPYGYQEFTLSGTWVNTVGVSVVRVTLVGGGGGGGNARQASSYPVQVVFSGGGGGGGAVVQAVVSVSNGVSYAINIGVGGTKRSDNYSGYPGNPGGTTSFGSLLSAAGGQGGTPQGSEGLGGTSGDGNSDGQSGSRVMAAQGDPLPIVAGGLGGVTTYSPYGNGGRGKNSHNDVSGTITGSNGNAGYAKIEWGGDIV